MLTLSAMTSWTWTSLGLSEMVWRSGRSIQKWGRKATGDWAPSAISFKVGDKSWEGPGAASSDDGCNYHGWLSVSDPGLRFTPVACRNWWRCLFAVFFFCSTPDELPCACGPSGQESGWRVHRARSGFWGFDRGGSSLFISCFSHLTFDPHGTCRTAPYSHCLSVCLSTYLPHTFVSHACTVCAGLHALLLIYKEKLLEK